MYIQKTTRYGNRTEIVKCHSSRYGVKGEKRRKKSQPTKEEVKKNNLQRMRHWLFMLLCINFIEGDHHLVLTYAEECLPDQKEARKNLSKFFRQMRKEYRKQGKVLKYIFTTEISKKGRIHHHLVINDCEGFSKLISTYWPYGGKHATPLYAEEDYEALADYLVKDSSEQFDKDGSAFRKRYSCSRNLEKPDVKTEVIKASDWRKKPRISEKSAAEGYSIESVYEGVDIFGFPYQKVVIRWRDPGKRKRR